MITIFFIYSDCNGLPNPPSFTRVTRARYGRIFEWENTVVVHWWSLSYSFCGNLPSCYSSTIFRWKEVIYLNVEKMLPKENLVISICTMLTTWSLTVWPATSRYWCQELLDQALCWLGNTCFIFMLNRVERCRAFVREHELFLLWKINVYYIVNEHWWNLSKLIRLFCIEKQVCWIFISKLMSVVTSTLYHLRSWWNHYFFILIKRNNFSHFL